MFDIAFTELLVIGIVALIVIGPERLPKVARTAGTWLGKLNRYVAQVKQDIDRDMQLEELRKLQEQMKASAQKYELMAEEASQKVQQEVGQVDKVMQAMAATDGGLALQEYEKIKAEQAASGEMGTASDAAASPPEQIFHHEGETVPERVDQAAATAVEAQADFQSTLEEDILADEMDSEAKAAVAKPPKDSPA
jgi:sec-independent protein translocase protein TatB